MPAFKFLRGRFSRFSPWMTSCMDGEIWCEEVDQRQFLHAKFHPIDAGVGHRTQKNLQFYAILEYKCTTGEFLVCSLQNFHGMYVLPP